MTDNNPKPDIDEPNEPLPPIDPDPYPVEDPKTPPFPETPEEPVPTPPEPIPIFPPDVKYNESRDGNRPDRQSVKVFVQRIEAEDNSCFIS